MTDAASTEESVDLTPPFPLPYPKVRPWVAPLGLGIVVLWLASVLVRAFERTSGVLKWMDLAMVSLWTYLLWRQGQMSLLVLHEDHVVLREGLLKRSRRVPYAQIQGVDLRWKGESFPDLRLTLRAEPPEEIRVALGGKFTDFEKKTAAWLQAKAATAVFE